MIKLLIVSALTLAACAPSDYSYSAEDATVLQALHDVADIINDVGGCELILVEPAGSYITPIDVEPEHYNGERILGCALVGRSLHLTPVMPHIVLAERTVARPEWLQHVLTHEVLHTIGFRHIEPVAKVMSADVYAPYNIMSDATVTRLQEMCQ